MTFAIEIKNEELKEYILQEVAKNLLHNFSNEDFDLKYGPFRKEFRKLIKEMIYEPELKEEIINRVINQAAKEISRKAIPIITNRTFNEEA